MICKPCGIAGDMIHELRAQNIRRSNIISEEFQRSARTLHLWCKGCDCQHAIDLDGKMVQSG